MKKICTSILILISAISIGYSQKNTNFINWSIDDYEVGKKYYDKKEYFSAIEVFDTIIDYNPWFFNAYYKRSYSNYHLKNYTQALKDIESAYEVSEKDHKYFYMKGQFYDKLEHFNIAQYYLDMAIRLKPEHDYYYKYRGGLLVELGQYKKAIDDYDYVLSKNHELYDLYFNRGVAKFNLKKREEACLDWWYGKEHSVSCERYFFYECGKIDLRGKEVSWKKYPTFSKPEFNYNSSQNFSKFLRDHIRYPVSVLKKGKEGMVIAQFDLDKDLKIVNFNILHSISPEFDLEVKRVIQLSESYWVKPATKNDIEVNYSVIVPVSFIIREGKPRSAVLSDSLDLLIKENNFTGAIALSAKILRLNPFNFEVFLKRKDLFNKNGSKDSIYSEQWFSQLRTSKAERLTEIFPSRKYVKLYYNSIWQITNKENAEYYRITEWNDEVDFFEGEYYDFTMDGRKVGSGEYSYHTKDGVFTSFYENGNTKSKISFENNVEKGIWNFYHENGTLKFSLSVNGYEFSVIEYKNENGESLMENDNCFFELKMLDYTKTDTIKISGKVKKNKKDQKWQFCINNELILEETYSAGKFIEGVYFNNGIATRTIQPSIGAWVFIPYEITRTETNEFAPNQTNQYTFIEFNPDYFK